MTQKRSQGLKLSVGSVIPGRDPLGVLGTLLLGLPQNTVQHFILPHCVLLCLRQRLVVHISGLLIVSGAQNDEQEKGYNIGYK